MKKKTKRIPFQLFLSVCVIFFSFSLLAASEFLCIEFKIPCPDGQKNKKLCAADSNRQKHASMSVDIKLGFELNTP